MSNLFELRKRATLLVSEETLQKAMQETMQIAKGIDRNDPQHANLERIYNFINSILKKTPQEMQQDGATVLTDYFDDVKMPQFANKLKASVEQIRNYRNVGPAHGASAKKAFRSRGRECDNCETSLGEDDFAQPGSWSYKCPECGFKYTHGGRDLSEQLAAFEANGGELIGDNAFQMVHRGSKQAAMGMEPKLKLQARDALAGIADSVSYSTKQGVLIAKHGYFYTHGMDERKFADRIVKACSAAGLKCNIVATSNHWNAWPKDSWFECRFTVEPSPIANKPTPAPVEAVPASVAPEVTPAVPAPEAAAPIAASTEKTSKNDWGEGVEPREEGQPFDAGFEGHLIKYSPEDFIDICNAKYGWAVAGQLGSILKEGEPYGDQNANALRYIRDFAREKGENELFESINIYLEDYDEQGPDLSNRNRAASKKADHGVAPIAPKQIGTRPAPDSAGPRSDGPAVQDVSRSTVNTSQPKAPTQQKKHTPDKVPVTSSQKSAMALNYEQVCFGAGLEEDPNAQSVEGEEVYWNPEHEGGMSGVEAVVILPDGAWEAYGGGGANDVIGEGHAPEDLQTWLNTEGQKRMKRGAVVAKRADEVTEPIVDEPIDEVPVEDEMPVDEGAAAMPPASPEMGAGMGGLDPQSLGTKALGAAIKALAGVPEFMDDKSAVLWIEQLSSVLKNRPVEQKAAKHHGQPAKCECGAKALPGSDMCGACEKEYAVANEKAASGKKVAVAPPGREDQVKALKKEDVDNPWAVAWDSYNKSHESSITAAWLGVRKKLAAAGVENADGVAWVMKQDGMVPHRAAFLAQRSPQVFVAKFKAAAGNAGGAFTSDQDTMEVDKGESEGSKRVAEIGEAHSMRDDNTGIKRPATVLPIKLAAGDMTPTKALKACEEAEGKLKDMYLDLKSVASSNNVAAVRNAVEAVYTASVLFDDAKKAFNKLLMAEEAKEEAEKASKKESKEASALDISSPLFALNIAAAE